jgi:hypothetical protein
MRAALLELFIDLLSALRMSGRSGSSVSALRRATWQ